MVCVLGRGVLYEVETEQRKNINHLLLGLLYTYGYSDFCIVLSL